MKCLTGQAYWKPICVRLFLPFNSMKKVRSKTVNQHSTIKKLVYLRGERGEDIVTEDTVVWVIGVHVHVGSKFGHMLAEVGKWPFIEFRCCAVWALMTVYRVLLWWRNSKSDIIGVVLRIRGSASRDCYNHFVPINHDDWKTVQHPRPFARSFLLLHQFKELKDGSIGDRNVPGRKWQRIHFSLQHLRYTRVCVYNQMWSCTQPANRNPTRHLCMRLRIGGWLWMLLINVFTSLLVIREQKVLWFLQVSKILSPSV